jgi:predicted Fe-Mo cluster-binding NifX family protein
MKIAVSATQPNLEGEVEARFGRCPYFILVDPETSEFEARENPNVEAASGAGVATGQFVASQGVREVLTGNIGPNAHQVLAAAGIKVYLGVSGKIRDVLEAYKTGQLRPATESDIGSGMGRGRRGMGRRMGPGAGYRPKRSPGRRPEPVGPGAPTSREEEIASLKNQAHLLSQELAEIKRRLDLLEKSKEN